MGASGGLRSDVVHVIDSVTLQMQSPLDKGKNIADVYQFGELMLACQHFAACTVLHEFGTKWPLPVEAALIRSHAQSMAPRTVMKL